MDEELAALEAALRDQAQSPGFLLDEMGRGVAAWNARAWNHARERIALVERVAALRRRLQDRDDRRDTVRTRARALITRLRKLIAEEGELLLEAFCTDLGEGD